MASRRPAAEMRAASTPPSSPSVRDRDHHLEVGLELRLGAGRAHDDAGVVGQVVAQPVGRRK